MLNSKCRFPFLRVYFLLSTFNRVLVLVIFKRNLKTKNLKSNIDKDNSAFFSNHIFILRLFLKEIILF